MNSPYDIAANRAARKYSRRELAARILWRAANPLFAFSPRICWSWRRWLLRRFGAKVGRNVQVFPSVRIAMPWNISLADDVSVGDRAILYALGQVTVGARSAISQGAHLCAGTHDWRQSDMPLLKLPIIVEEDVWICADAFIGPDINIGRGAIVAARAVAMKSVPADTIAFGNPVMFCAKHRDLCN